MIKLYDKKDIYLIDKFRECLLKGISNEINEIQKKPIKINEILILPNLQGYLICQNNNRLKVYTFQGKIDLNSLKWNYNTSTSNLPYSIRLDGVFPADEYIKLLLIILKYSDLHPQSSYMKKVVNFILKDQNNFNLNNDADLFLSEKDLTAIINQYFIDELAVKISLNDLYTSILLNIKLNKLNYYCIARLLNLYYPDQPLLLLTNKRLIGLINKLPNLVSKFKMSDDEILDAIMYSWIHLSDEE